MKFAVITMALFSAFPGFCQRGGKSHFEDLSALRPRFTFTDSSFQNTDHTPRKPGVAPVMTVNEKVNAVLDSIDKINTLRKFVDGFTIQIYSGQNREDANNTKKKMLEEIGDMKADLQYLQPKFRVKTGNYFTRLEAQKDLLRLKHVFPNAILVPERIPIK